MGREMIVQHAFGVVGDIIKRAREQGFEPVRERRQSVERQRRAVANDAGLAHGVGGPLLLLDLRFNIRRGGKGKKTLEIHTGRRMRLQTPAGRGDLAGFGAALRGKVRVFRRELYAILANDDAVQVPLLIDVDHLAGVDIFGDEHSVENRKVGFGCRPARTVKTRRTGVQQKLDRGLVRAAKHPPSEDRRRVAGLKGTQYGANRRFAEPIRANNEHVFAKLRIAGRR